MPVARCGLCGWLAHAKAMFNLGGLPRVAAPYMQQETWARLVFYTSVAAFAVGGALPGHDSQAMQWRRGVSRTDLLDEVVFRVIFLAGILMLPLAPALAADALLNSAEVFVLGAIIGWPGLLLRWWWFATLGKYFTTVVKTSAIKRS